MKQIAIYVTEKTDTKTVKKIREYYDNSVTVFIALDDKPGFKPAELQDFSVVNVASVSFYDRVYLMFLSAEDMKRHHKAKNKKILLVKKADIIKIGTINLQDTEILIEDKKGIREAKNAELQPLLR